MLVKENSSAILINMPRNDSIAWASSAFIAFGFVANFDFSFWGCDYAAKSRLQCFTYDERQRVVANFSQAAGSCSDQREGLDG